MLSEYLLNRAVFFEAFVGFARRFYFLFRSVVNVLSRTFSLFLFHLMAFSLVIVIQAPE
jgi:hypothetical protein